MYAKAQKTCKNLQAIRIDLHDILSKPTTCKPVTKSVFAFHSPKRLAVRASHIPLQQNYNKKIEIH